MTRINDYARFKESGTCLDPGSWSFRTGVTQPELRNEEQTAALSAMVFGSWRFRLKAGMTRRWLGHAFGAGGAPPSRRFGVHTVSDINCSGVHPRDKKRCGF